MSNRFSYPNLGFGLGLRQPHYEHILASRPRSVEWFEIISENFIESHRGYWNFLADLRRDYPIVMHGVSMSIGGTDAFNRDYFSKLKSLAAFLEAPWISDHLCWTGTGGIHTHDLLPLPYTEEALEHLVQRVTQAQELLGRRLVLENPSSYLSFTDSLIPEWEFMAELSKRADCGILLDVNNVYVNSVNHGFNPHLYLDALPKDRIVQIHLAGHEHRGTHIIDTHDCSVVDEVWELYAYCIAHMGCISTMVEWDDEIPSFETLVAELNKARAYIHLLQRKAG